MKSVVFFCFRIEAGVNSFAVDFGTLEEAFVETVDRTADSPFDAPCLGVPLLGVPRFGLVLFARCLF